MTPSAKTIRTSRKSEVDHAPPTQEEEVSLRAAWRWWLSPALIALLLTLYYIDPFIGDWDGLDYTVLSLRGEPSTMALGRLLFIFFNHALWRIARALFQIEPAQAYLIFKYVVVAQSPLVVIACWQLARDLTRSVYAATIAALLVAVSPIFVIYSGQVMTDVPSLLIVTLALILHLRGIRSGRVWVMLLGAALLGAGVNVRETTAFYAPWLAFAPFVCGWRFKAREIFLTLAACAVFLILAFAPFALWYALDVNGYRAAWHGWRESLRAESARHPIGLSNLIPFALYFFALSPMTFVALPAAAWKEWRARKLSPTLLLALVGLFATLLLFFNYSTVINWRYFLTGLPALVPLVASYLMRAQAKLMRSERRAFWSVAAFIIFIAVMCGIYLKPISNEHVLKRAETKNYRARLAPLPPDAVVIAG
ncbi:MAG: glycosyltransferase family 39 protein, partial [Pyrinomonadaceae bacterium]|nr:glycosyltransferase family 39 protein [Pyrinomonadaceae bacterium]